ncbi:hypothetical protein LTR04_007112 [Oleoguttula sp. CCFEE 6159]|nr:hypothetical protein LTR04_007112 [Oleoguttula sp. CCFEE 6159]
MAPRRPKTLAEQIADLEDPAPKDFDPEEHGEPQSDSEESASDGEANGLDGREHYVDVGKSTLRKRDTVLLGPQYEGSRISRHAVQDDEDEDDPFSRGFENETSEEDELPPPAANGHASHGANAVGESEHDEQSDMDDGDGPEEEDGSSATDLSDEEEDDQDDGTQKDDRAELRRIMAEEQKTVAAAISQAAKADAEKGRAVKTQRTTFDSLLNTRIRLQKALIATNTFPAVNEEPTELSSSNTAEEAIRAAQTAAFTLWSSLTSLRESLTPTSTGQKRKRPSFMPSTPTSSLWTHMQSQEAASVPHRNAVLEKWSGKARGATTLPLARRLNNTAASQTIVDVLAEQLSNPTRLIARTRIPRSCAPLQASRRVPESADIYDDADFYGLLLKELLEQRAADTVVAAAVNIDVAAGLQMRREAKTRKNVDTKASKGRKLRYTVHEKLQNFMAPQERGSWGERQVDELFGALLGRRMGLGEDVEMDDGDGDAEEDVVEAGLKLFRN